MSVQTTGPRSIRKKPRRKRKRGRTGFSSRAAIEVRAEIEKNGPPSFGDLGRKEQEQQEETKKKGGD